MKKDCIHIESVHETHHFLSLGKLKYPLISVFKFGKEQTQASN
jgi:hypothetical protein